MLRNASTINGYSIAASDGVLGTVSDFLFDDATWRVRWLVVDTGNWLPGRNVLLPPSVLGHLDPKKRDFAVRLTMKQVGGSPDIDTHRPVSRQLETSLYDYYGWSPYWGTGFYVGGYIPMSPGIASMERERHEHLADIRHNRDEPHLRSIAAVTGYHIHATDGALGHVEDFLIEEADWSIHYLIVDTKNWWPGKKVLVSPHAVRTIDWPQKRINLDVDRQRIKDSPPYEAKMTLDREYEEKFDAHYGERYSKRHLASESTVPPKS